jgi:hypothetical protein
MPHNGMATPPDISPETLAQLLSDTRSREILLAAKIRQFKERYKTSLEELEERLERGEGNEHPDWEDSIEWRSAVENLALTQQMQSLLEWLLSLNEPSNVL